MTVLEGGLGWESGAEAPHSKSARRRRRPLHDLAGMWDPWDDREKSR